jgi:preprotein translocase subunit SecA
LRSDLPIRPGVVRGLYPERDDRIPGRLEETWGRFTGRLRQWFWRSRQVDTSLVAACDRHGVALAALDDAGLAEVTRELRRDLRRGVLDGPAAVRGFALVRELAGRILGMRPYDVQLLGGWVMLQGGVAEMQTGEGKTLTATLPASIAALAGIPVHIVTVNDYLVTRDAAAMSPLYRALGLTVGVITEDMDQAQRQAAYGCDICYCTNKQLTFDYLRDRLVRAHKGDALRLRLGDLLGAGSVRGALRLRGLCYAIIDEADSVLVDEARTPLIIARGQEVAEVARHYAQALDLAAVLEPGRDFLVRYAEREVELTPAGRTRLAGLAADLGGLWGGKGRREDLVTQALSARELFHRDTHYLVHDGKVQIVDEYTGRLMPDRSWERGLHQLIETKEGCAVTPVNETQARISYQRFFRRYLRLAGMTGTAREVAAELWSIYRLRVVTIPTNRPLRRSHLPPRVYVNGAIRWQAIVARAAELAATGRPVLIGTRSVGASERLSELMNAVGLEHRLLNARQDLDEAQLVAMAGGRARVTVATNMAGRGTDIPLPPGVAEQGGLHVIASEYHEARRIDRQLFGRCARQGDPGSAEYQVALDDDLTVQFYPRRFLALYLRLLWLWVRPDGRLPPLLGVPVMRFAQLSAERRYAWTRRQLLRLDDQLGDLLAFSGKPD